MRARTSAILLATLLSGCGGVFSTQPASDDTTSRLDERLVGFWRIDVDATPGAKDGSSNDSILVVGHKKGAEKTLEVVGVELHQDKTIETSRYDVRATTIEKRALASLKLVNDKEEDKGKEGWVVLRYEMPDADTLRVLAMDEKAVAADVRAEKLAGTVAESKKDGGGEPDLTVTLTASTTVLRAYLDQRGDDVMKTAKPLVLRRLRLR
jgi:hypothetical protein